MSDSTQHQPSDPSKRRFLLATTGVVGGVAAAAVAVPFIGSLFPSAKAKAAGASVEIDISKLEAGQLIRSQYRGKTIWVMQRTPEMLAALPSVRADLADPDSLVEQQPDYCKNETRSIKPEILITEGVCTHLGCSPTLKGEMGGDMGASWKGGFYCPCHGSKFDLSGRVFSGVPAPKNLNIPKHYYINDKLVLVGEDKKGA